MKIGLEDLFSFLLNKSRSEASEKNAGFIQNLHELMGLNNAFVNSGKAEKLDGDKLITIEFLANRIVQLLEEL